MLFNITFLAQENMNLNAFHLKYTKLFIYGKNNALAKNGSYLVFLLVWSINAVIYLSKYSSIYKQLIFGCSLLLNISK